MGTGFRIRTKETNGRACPAICFLEARRASRIPMSDEKTYYHGAFFGRRKGHPLRARQADVFNTLLPRLALDLAAPAPANLATLFPSAVDDTRVEIGFGGGEHLLAQAQRHPRTGF